MSGPDVMGGMGPMMDGTQIGHLDEGRPFDLQFIDQMTLHHQQAIEMARRTLGRSERPEIKGLARKIIDEQSDGSEQMQSYLKEVDER